MDILRDSDVVASQLKSMAHLSILCHQLPPSGTADPDKPRTNHWEEIVSVSETT